MPPHAGVCDGGSPAWAGIDLSGDEKMATTLRFPRVGGDRPC